MICFCLYFLQASSGFSSYFLRSTPVSTILIPSFELPESSEKLTLIESSDDNHCLLVSASAQFVNSIRKDIEIPTFANHETTAKKIKDKVSACPQYQRQVEEQIVV